MLTLNGGIFWDVLQTIRWCWAAILSREIWQYGQCLPAAPAGGDIQTLGRAGGRQGELRRDGRVGSGGHPHGTLKQKLSQSGGDILLGSGWEDRGGLTFS